jgi:hypothetical protein
MPHESEETYNLLLSNQVMTDSVWTKRECPRASDRVDKPMENAWRFPQLDHTHSPLAHTPPRTPRDNLKTPAAQP